MGKPDDGYFTDTQLRKEILEYIERDRFFKYAIEGRTKEARKVRVIVAFVQEMLIITVMEL